MQVGVVFDYFAHFALNVADVNVEQRLQLNNVDAALDEDERVAKQDP